MRAAGRSTATVHSTELDSIGANLPERSRAVEVKIRAKGFSRLTAVDTIPQMLPHQGVRFYPVRKLRDWGSFRLSSGRKVVKRLLGVFFRLKVGWRIVRMPLSLWEVRWCNSFLLGSRPGL